MKISNFLSKVVYQFQCPGDPEIKYVGFTNRTISERVREHTRPGTAVFDHISTCTACQDEGITIKNFRILKKCRYKTDTAIHEALIIKKFRPVLNHNLKKPGWTWCLQLFNWAKFKLIVYSSNVISQANLLAEAKVTTNY